VGFGQRSSQDRKVLREHEHFPAFDQTVACDDAVAQELLFVQSKKGAAVLYQPTNFNKRMRIQEELDALPSGEFSFRVLGIDAGLTSAQKGFGVQGLETIEGGFLSHGSKIRRSWSGNKVKRLIFYLLFVHLSNCCIFDP
jgi:hypothetical protein